MTKTKLLEKEETEVEVKPEPVIIDEGVTKIFKTQLANLAEKKVAQDKAIEEYNGVRTGVDKFAKDNWQSMPEYMENELVKYQVIAPKSKTIPGRVEINYTQLIADMEKAGKKVPMVKPTPDFIALSMDPYFLKNMNKYTIKHPDEVVEGKVQTRLYMK